MRSFLEGVWEEEGMGARDGEREEVGGGDGGGCLGGERTGRPGSEQGTGGVRGG